MTVETFAVPELEELARNWTDPKIWTEQQLWRLDRYYGRVPMSRLRDVVQHSIESCHKKAAEIGITLPRPPLESADE